MPMRVQYGAWCQEESEDAHDARTQDDGTPVSDAMVEAMADQAEHGYDVDEILQRRQPGRPPMGSAAASVESVRLDPS